eukprot:4525217-Ditylum_brightwellii.AAC.1
MKLTGNYCGGASRFLHDFETIVTEMSLSTGETMKDSDLVRFLKTAISKFQPFHSIKASLDTNALMNKQDITYKGMLHMCYNNCPTHARGAGNPHSVNSFKKNGGAGLGSGQQDAWKKDFTKWVPMKVFKTLPESKQKACREAISKAKAEKKAKVNAVSTSSTSQSDQTESTVSVSDISLLTSNNVEVPSELAPTF